MIVMVNDGDDIIMAHHSTSWIINMSGIIVNTFNKKTYLLLSLIILKPCITVITINSLFNFCFIAGYFRNKNVHIFEA